MGRELWPPLCRLLKEVAKDFSQKYVQMQPWVLVAVMLWAALHDRPVSWACQPRHWSTTTPKPCRLPSAATLSRRIDGVAVGLPGRALEEGGQPLPIGGNGKGPDARFGRGAGCVAKGYKPHALWSNRALAEAWEITPPNVGEKGAAEALIARLGYGGCLLARVAPCRKAKAPGCGKHYRSPHRLRGLALLQGDFGKALFRARTAIARPLARRRRWRAGRSRRRHGCEG